MGVRVKLCAIAKDEGPYLADWVFHHLHFGFDAVEVWVNSTQDPSLRILRRIHRAHPQVRGRRADRLLTECLAAGENFQRRAYTRLARRARREGFSHVAFLDLDEYWLPRDFRSPVQDFIPTDLDVNVVSFPWCLQVPRPESEPFLPPLSAPVELQLEQYVKSVVRLDGSVKGFREHTAWTHRGTRLLVRDPFPFVDDEDQGGGSVIPRQLLEAQWETLPEAFVVHAMNRSPLEFVASIVKGARQTGRDAPIKPNRYDDLPTAAPILAYRLPRLPRWRYQRARRRFHREVKVARPVARSQELLAQRCAALLDRAVADDVLREQLNDALRGIPPQVLERIRVGWDGSGQVVGRARPGDRSRSTVGRRSDGHSRGARPTSD